MQPRRLYDIARLRARSLTRRGAVERDLGREFRFHLEQLVEENIARGMPPDLALANARRAIGGITQWEEECRDMRQTNRIDALTGDLRYALRTLAHAPGFTAVMVLTLALSIGANSAIFSVIQGVLLRPLPYPHPERIVRIFFKSDTYPKFPLNPFDLRDFRSRNRTFDNIAGIVRSDVQLSGAGEPVMLHSFAVTSGYFGVLGLSPSRGREFTVADEAETPQRIAILSDRLWKTRFSADPTLLGRSITLNTVPYQVVGIMPPGAQHPGNDYHAIADGENVDLWIPFPYGKNTNQRGSHFMEGVGRLKPGITPEQGNADLSAVLQQMAKEHTGKDWRVYLVPLFQETVGRMKKMLIVLLAAVGLLLLIACVNAANLLLARSSARVREIAVRAALGAARARIVRQLLTESVVISLAGAALGAVVAVGGVRLLVAFLPAGFPRASEIRLDAGVFAFTLATGVLTGLFFGLVPALTASKADLQQSLREGARGSTGSGRHLRLRGFLVVGETALACVLLIAAGLMLHSFVNLLQADPGFRPQQVLTGSLSLPGARYKTTAQFQQFYDRLIHSLQPMAGVQSVGVGSDLPWTGYDENAGGFVVEGRSSDYNDKTTARYHGASNDYFRAVGIPLDRGRFFTDHDDANAPNVIVINQAMAKRYWPGEDAVGKRISFNDRPAKDKDWMYIVGVVGDVKDRPESAAAQPAFWWPLTQVPFNLGNMSVVLRSSGDPAQLASQLRNAVHALDSELAVADLRLLNHVASESLSTQRFALFLIALFAALALLLATIGIYGVISYSVNQRMPEFGMRMALGARSWDLVRMILRQGLTLALIGSAIGLLAAAAFSRLLGTLLYGVTGTDPLTFTAVGLLALITTSLACYLPARRATQADPMSTLRAE